MRETGDWVAWHIELSKKAYLAICLGDESFYPGPAPVRKAILYLDQLGDGEQQPGVPPHDQRVLTVNPKAVPYDKFDIAPTKRLYFVCKQISPGPHTIILELEDGSPYYNSDLERYQARNLYIAFLTWFYC